MRSKRTEEETEDCVSAPPPYCNQYIHGALKRSKDPPASSFLSGSLFVTYFLRLFDVTLFLFHHVPMNALSVGWLNKVYGDSFKLLSIDRLGGGVSTP